MATGLHLLLEYTSDDDTEDEPPTPKRPKLPLPFEMNLTKPPEVVDDPSLHNGKTRSYPHERGNWSSYVYVPYPQKETFDVFCDQVIKVFSPDLDLIKIDEPHISLSKTFVLYYHWIKEFYASLKMGLAAIPSYEVTFDSIKVYCNEDFSRTFIALAVGSSRKDLLSSIKIIDHSLEEYKLPTYYEDSSFHMSFVWCLGNKKDLIQKKMKELENIYDLFVDSSDFSLSVDHYIFKTGFKEFKISLNKL